MMLPLISFLTIISNIFLGLIVLIRNPSSVTNRLFALVTFAICGWTITNYYSLSLVEPGLTIFWIRLVMVTVAVLFSLLFILAHTFPYFNLRLTTRRLLFIITETVLISYLALSPYVFSHGEFSNDQITPVPSFGMPLYALHIFLYLGATIWILWKKQKEESGTIKTQVRYMLLGISFTFSLATITTFVFTIILKNTSLVVLGPTYTLILVGVLAYAIVRDKFLDIGLVVARTASYAVFSAIIVLLYIFTITQLAPYFQSSNDNLLNGIFLLIALILVPPLKNIIEKLTDKLFYKASYSPEKLLTEISTMTNSTLELEDLTRKFLETILNGIKITRGSILVISNGKLYYESKKGYPSQQLDYKTICHLLNLSHKKSVYFDEIEEGSIKNILRKENISFLSPLFVKKELEAILILGEKSSGEVYSIQDQAILKISSPQLAISIKNAKSYSQIQQFNITLKDEIKTATQKLRKANSHLRHLDKLKDEFVYIATHELKNPVTAMRGYLSMIHEGFFGNPPEKMREALTQLEASNEQLVELVNDLLEIARTESKTLTIKTNPLNLVEIINEVSSNLKPSFDQKKLKFKHLCKESEITVLADPGKLKEVIVNLLSNAVKYSESGTISVSHVISDNQVITHISDEGFGISPDDQKKLFTRFFRAEEASIKGIPGTGLGLFIVKQLVEKMGGKIWFTSKINQGTTFTFTLPQAKT